MQLKENSLELIKEEVFEEVYKQILEGKIQNKVLIDLVFKYFYGNSQLFRLHYQPLEERPKKNIHQDKMGPTHLHHCRTGDRPFVCRSTGR